jgi:predicted DNA-binding transcriptional regulator YafY
MNICERIQKEEHLQFLLLKGRAGDNLALSVKLGVDARTVRRYIKKMRAHGWNISFDASQKRYILLDIDETKEDKLTRLRRERIASNLFIQ